MKQPTNAYYKNKSYLDIFLQRIREGGLLFALRRVVGFIFDLSISPFLFLKPKRYFRFQGKKFSYLYRYYNKTWKNCRAVEIPIALDYVASHNGKRVLEFGNVINHYKKFNHVVLDKYESSLGVLNEDII